jgi:predicted nuclease with TOPRIM domain
MSCEVVPAKLVKLQKWRCSMGLDYVNQHEYDALERKLNALSDENEALRFMLVRLVQENQRLEEKLEGMEKNAFELKAALKCEDQES